MEGSIAQIYNGESLFLLPVSKERRMSGRASGKRGSADVAASLHLHGDLLPESRKLGFVEDGIHVCVIYTFWREIKKVLDNAGHDLPGAGFDKIGLYHLLIAITHRCYGWVSWQRL